IEERDEDGGAARALEREAPRWARREQPAQRLAQGRARDAHRARKSGLYARSLPIVVAAPCPVMTRASSGKVSSLPRIDFRIASESPPQRSVRPMVPRKSVSPANT